MTEGSGCLHSRMVPGLMGLQAAKPLAITAHTHLQGWCTGWMPVLTSALSWGSPRSSLQQQQQQHNGMLSTTRGPQHLPGTTWDKLWQGAGRSEPCPVCVGTQLLPRRGDPRPQGAAGDILVRLIPPPQHPAAERWASPGGPSRGSSPDLNVRAVHRQRERVCVSLPS